LVRTACSSPLSTGAISPIMSDVQAQAKYISSV
jgi:hypothetical protein